MKIEDRVHIGSGNFSSWGTAKYYDEQNNVVIDDNFSDARPFSNGTALVMKGGTLQRGGMYGGKWGLIDADGNYLVEPVWDLASRTEDGYITYSIITEADGEKVFHNWAADPKGNILTADEYRQFRLDHYGKYYSIEENGLEGVVDVDNQIVLPLIFSSHAVYLGFVDGVNEGYCKVNREGRGADYIKFIDMPILQGSVFVNSEKVEFDTPPLLINNRTMIPIRAVFEKIGCEVEWIEDTETAVITLGDIQIEIKQDTNYITKNGEYIYSDTAAINYNDRIYVPIRLICEAFGYDVAYDDVTENVLINI